MKTKEGAKTYDHSMNHALEFFAKAGSLFEKRDSFYGEETSAKKLFINTFMVDQLLSMKLLMWLRDCRGGAGNRSGARSIIQWLGNNYTEWMRANFHFIPVHGRWDDLTALFKTPLRNQVGDFWATAINGGDVLAAKWCKRHYKPVRQALNLRESDFRKLLANLRKDHIVEHKMCQREWNKINYSKVPSVAMARYTKCFAKNDEERFKAYKESVKKGNVTIKADVLFPHDCVRTALHGDGEAAELQFNALPNFMEESDENVMVICDSSGSMESRVSGSVEAIHVSMGMALYCSSRVPESSPFYKRFITFCDEGRFIDWRKHTFSSALKDKKVFDRAVGSTRIDKALDTILNIAINRNIKQELMPSCLLIVSDMQFHQGAVNDRSWDRKEIEHQEQKRLTEIEASLRKWNDAGYKRPKIVYWNTAGYEGSQDTVASKNIGLISGFSPSICKAIFEGDDFSPLAIMNRAIAKYEVIDPTMQL
jgi:hypothetical protein